MRFFKRAALALLFLAGCQGTYRDCASCSASAYGADWLIVQYAASGAIVNCWRLRAVSVTNEKASDGIFWQAEDGHLVHISGWYNRVQVVKNDWDGAARALGLDVSACPGGRMAKPESDGR